MRKIVRVPINIQQLVLGRTTPNTALRITVESPTKSFVVLQLSTNAQGLLTIPFNVFPMQGFFNRQTEWYKLTVFNALNEAISLSAPTEPDNRASELFLFHASFEALVFNAVYHVFSDSCGSGDAGTGGFGGSAHNTLSGLQGGDATAGNFFHVTPQQIASWDAKEAAGVAAALVSALIDGAPVNANTLNKLYQLILQFNNVEVVADIAARNALDTALYKLVIVQDASADPIVASGAAMYAWQESPVGVWVLIAVFDNINAVLSWENIQNKPSVFPPSAHGHTPAQILTDDDNMFVSQAEKDAWNAKQNPLGQATETVLGLMQLATEAEALAGTDTQKAIVAATLRAAINALIGGAPTEGNTLGKLYTLIQSIGGGPPDWADIQNKPDVLTRPELVTNVFEDDDDKPVAAVVTAELRVNLTTLDIRTQTLESFRTDIANRRILTQRVTFATVFFNQVAVYGSVNTPITAGTIAFNFTDAILGMVQRMIHQGSSEPTLPAQAKRLSGSYVNNQINIFYFDYEDNNNVYYTISQVQ